MRLTKYVVVLLLTVAKSGIAEKPPLAVGPQYDSTHVYVAPEDFNKFVTSVIATFGGTTSKLGMFKVTPTPSSTMSQLVLTPVGTISVFGYKTAIPYPFGLERTGYLVTDIEAAVKRARATGADILVAPFNDLIGRDSIIQWPGGINTQIYWHTVAPSYAALKSVPENRIYVPTGRASAFIHSFIAFSHGKITSDERHAPGTDIGRPGYSYRRVKLTSAFGRMTVFATDGQLPYPYGREITGYEVADLTETLAKATVAGVVVLVPPYVTEHRSAAIVQFPGGYIAEIHSPTASPGR